MKRHEELRHLQSSLTGYGTPGGRWEIKFRGAVLIVIATWGYEWDHVSVSTEGRCPTWEEMEHVRKMFFKPDETVMQLHVPEPEHVNCHPHCLHMWRPQNAEIPKPPAWMVGPKGIVEPTTLASPSVSRRLRDAKRRRR